MEFGNERFKRLRKVMLHNPKSSLTLINRGNYKKYLFDNIPDARKFYSEHEKYKKLLEEYGIETFELSDLIVRNRDLAMKLPNLTFLHDIAVILSGGSVISEMMFWGRKNENVAVKEALANLKIPVFMEFNRDEIFEGFLPFSREIAILAETERHNKKGVDKFLDNGLDFFKEIIFLRVPKERRYMHADMVFGRVRKDLALAYPPAFESVEIIKRNERFGVNFLDYMSERGVEIIDISSEEQRNWGCTFVPLEPGAIFHYDIALSQHTVSELKSHGVDIIRFSPKALLAGGGSLRCLTLQLLRK